MAGINLDLVYTISLAGCCLSDCQTNTCLASVFIHRVQFRKHSAMILLAMFLFGAILPSESTLNKFVCSSSPSDALTIENVPSHFEFNGTYIGKGARDRSMNTGQGCSCGVLVSVSSNDSRLLAYVTLEVGSSSNATNGSVCKSANATSVAHHLHRLEFILKFEKNSTPAACVQLG